MGADELVAGGYSRVVAPRGAEGRVGATAEPPNAANDTEDERLPAAEDALYTAGSPR
jgi:hypothetical protein